MPLPPHSRGGDRLRDPPREPSGDLAGLAPAGRGQADVSPIPDYMDEPGPGPELMQYRERPHIARRLVADPRLSLRLAVQVVQTGDEFPVRDALARVDQALDPLRRDLQVRELMILKHLGDERRSHQTLWRQPFPLPVPPRDPVGLGGHRDV